MQNSLKQGYQIPPDLMNFDQDYFPQYTMFLLSDEEKNIGNFKERIQKEKQRVNNDIEIFKQEFTNLIEDIRHTLLEKIDEHFVVFIEKYKKFKNEVIEFKNINLEVPTQHIKPPSAVNHTNASNLALIQELEDLRFKSQIAKIQQYISEIQKENYNRILSSSQEILTLMSQSQQLYNSTNTCNSFKDIKSQFAQNLQLKFEPLNPYVKSSYITEDDLVLPNDQSQQLNNSDQKSQYQQQQHQQQYSQYSEQKQQQQLDNSQQHINIQNYQFQDKIPKLPSQIISYPKMFPQNTDPKLNLRQQIPTTHQQIILCLYAYSQNILVTGSKDGLIELYNTDQKRHIATLQGHQGSICCLSKISNYLVSGSDHGDCSIILWDMVNFTPFKTLYGHQAAVVQILPLFQQYQQIEDQKILISASYDKYIIFWDTQSQTPLEKLQSHNSSITAIAQSQSTLVSSSLDNILNIYTINLQNNQYQNTQIKNQVEIPSYIIQMQILNNSLISGHQDGNIRKINLETGTIEQCFKVCMTSLADFVLIKDITDQIKILGTGVKETSMFSLDMQNGKIQRIQNIHGLYVQFGCGIGPAIQHISDNQIAWISQLPNEKQITISELDLTQQLI